MVKKKKGTKPRRLNPVNRSLQDNTDTFEVLTDPPPPTRGATPETIAFLAKLDRTFAGLEKGQAFIIPTNKVPLCKRHFAAVYTDAVMKYIRIPDNQDFTRVYWLQPDKKTKPTKR